MNPVLPGTDLKFRVTSSGAFSWTEHEWDVVFKVGSKACKMTKRNNGGGGFTLTCDQKNMGVKPRSDGSWIFLLDSAYFGHGRLYAYVTEYIPDTDFDPNGTFTTLDGIRNEVQRESLISIATL